MTGVAIPKAAAPAAPVAPAPAAAAPALFGAGVPAPAAPAAPAAAAAPVKAAAPAAGAPKLGDPIEPPAAPKLGDAPPAAGAPDAPDAPAAEGDEAAVPAEEGAEAEEAPAPVYEFEAPEGQTPYQAEVIDAYKAVLGKHKVDPAVAKDILETVLPVLEKNTNDQINAGIQKQRDEWSQALAERYGDKLPATIARANRAFHEFVPPALQKDLAGSAMSVNPDFIAMWDAIGARITNDRPPKSTKPAPAPQLDPVDEIAAGYDAADAAAAARRT